MIALPRQRQAPHNWELHLQVWSMCLRPHLEGARQESSRGSWCTTWKMRLQTPLTSKVKHR
ncbi:hypothetical protein DPMN_036327 [Dreissena polymorpha]|uniref:Uncharacterized protein n=1 Tax=Dreissena polymorpha TaxID=45954 RepID=A0A9D4MDF0_DREPO|nr:hypothetical protein DPMN_036327 [Dreissena polymorpha]